MSELYNKQVLKEYTISINGDYFTCVILDDIDCYNIHILNDYYQKNELNTLQLQEPKACVNINELDNIFMQSRILEFYLWHINYGYKDKSYSFNIEVADSFELAEV